MRVSDFLIAKVGEGELIPKGYGLAWRKFEMAESIFLPIPINIIVSFARAIYYRMMMAFYPTKFDKLINSLKVDEYEKGYKLGLRDGENYGMKKAEKMIGERLDSFATTPFDKKDKVIL